MLRRPLKTSRLLLPDSFAPIFALIASFAFNSILPARADPDPRALADLRAKAAAADAPAAMAAIHSLAEMADPAQPGLADLTRALMNRDAALIDKWAAVLDPAKIKALETERAALREKALANLGKLDKGEPLTLAKQYHAKLKELTNRINIAFGQRWQIVEALRRRTDCAALLDKLVEKHDEPADKSLAARAERALSIDLPAALAIPELGDVSEPRTDSPEYALWHYRICRRIESYNKLQADAANKWESTSVRLLNDYRESLGLFPLEIDPRLSLAARLHSKEMCDLKYFNHASPTPGQDAPVDRMKNAGYNAGWRENIAANVADPERTFWLWFNSPGHHIAMTAPEEIAIGCGRWDNAWTHTFGHGLRLSLKSPAERDRALAAINAPGVYLKPQPDDAKLPRVITTRVETDIFIIDPKTGEKIPLNGK